MPATQSRPARPAGSAALPLSDELLAQYRQLIDTVPQKTPVREALDALLVCTSKWWDLPESSGNLVATHPVFGAYPRLDKEIADALFDSIPWEHELDAIQKLFDEIPFSDADHAYAAKVQAWRDAGADESKKPGTPPVTLRNVAKHLLWHVKELNLDREPLTSDKL